MASNRELSEFHNISFEEMVDLINELREKNEELSNEIEELSKNKNINEEE